MKNFVNKSLNHIASLRVTGAPLNCKKHAEHVFIHNPRVFRAALLSKLSLACLLTALLALPHCKNDDNGGGGGGSDEDSPPADAPPAALSAIYLWVTGCTVRGDMNGGDCPALPASAPANGPTRADAICANRYEADVDEASRDRIAGEGNSQHTAMLARSNDPPREVFPVRGKDTLEIKRPDETLIADSWDQFFDPSIDLSAAGGVSVTGTNVQYWTGWFEEAGQFTPRGSSGDFLYCGNVGDGAGAYWTVGTDVVQGKRGVGNAVNEGRLNMGGRSCNANNVRILCITH